jgi:hypothetical protein
MANYLFARNVARAYFEIEAESEQAARAVLAAAEDESEFRTGERYTDTDEFDFELIDVEETQPANP